MRMSFILSLALAAVFSGSAQAALNTPEATLLTQAEIIAGQQHTDAERTNLMSKFIVQYDQTAPQAGREERFVNALEEMNIMTPARAEAFRATVDQAVKTEAAANPNGKASEIFESALANVLRNSDVGAQFSACSSDFEWAGIFAAGAAASVVAFTQTDGDFLQQSAAEFALAFGTASAWFLLESGKDCR